MALLPVASLLFVATPVLAWLKERQPRYRALRERAAADLAKGKLVAPVPPVVAGEPADVPVDGEDIDPGDDLRADDVLTDDVVDDDVPAPAPTAAAKPAPYGTTTSTGSPAGTARGTANPRGRQQRRKKRR